jgi:hypothetical protein
MACSQCAAEDHQESATTAERVRYFPRQLLTADDMRTEQDYFREKLRRHNRLLHGWGVICGLEVVVDPGGAPMGVSICPGYALGPWGDEIAVEEAMPLDLTYCAQPRTADCTPAGAAAQPPGKPPTLLVQIRYVECKSRPMRTLPGGCGCDETACEYSRLRDGFALRCTMKPPPAAAVNVPPVNQKVPACLPCATDPWIVLAEVQTGAASLTIKNDVRRVIANTPSLAGH